MFKNERESKIYDYLEKQKNATVKELSELLYISESSIRRDLANLEKKGLIMRSYGGAEIISSSTKVLPFSTRSYDYIAEKQMIASKAVSLINEGDIVFLDQSSTSYFLARAMINMSGVTVITNNLEILSLLCGCGMNVHSSGGIISRANTNCLIGNNAQRTFEEVYADISFFSARALSSDGVISDYTQEEIFVRNSMLKNADKKVFLCNSAKFNTHSAYKQCTLSDVDYFISENSDNQKFSLSFPNLNIL